MTVAVMFPGQGAQAPALGKPWQDDPAWAVVERAEKATGVELAPLLLDAPAERLARTREAQLVVFLASLLAWERVRTQISTPCVFAGHSLGQITALVAAGAIDVDDGSRLAVRRAELTQDAADRFPGKLVALLGIDGAAAEEACAAAPGECWVANDNAPGQVVIGGTPEGVDKAGERARELGAKRVIALNVGGAFHTPLMQPAADGLAAELDTISFSDTAVPVVSNVDALPYTDGPGWRERLRDQLVNPVQWRATVPCLVELGAETLLEVGPGTTLTGLAKRAASGITLRNVSVPSDLTPTSEAP